MEPVQKTEMTLGTCIHHLCSEIQKKDADRNLIEQEVMEYLSAVMRGEHKEDVVTTVGVGEGFSEVRIVDKDVGAKENEIKC